ncbi:Histone-lysine N-methyltransferase SETMAR [Araneus ventricosus]|uniref:Histone-lysine N-methyltransferase SETMAR n=1 Tax=Araneus ventricosus TaxID=182803 RepID=A0A4Y2FT93_ARAVE|nr:Histone-lysine N-methyltransferase SETMAR [Araneus ventricosus]
MSCSSAASSLSQVATAFSNSSSLPERLPPRKSFSLWKRWKSLGAIRVRSMQIVMVRLRKLRRAIQNRRRRTFSGGIVLLRDNARPHTAAATQESLDQFGWEIFDHPPYSPDLAPNDLNLFLNLKEFVGGKRFGSDEELENAVTTWLNELVTEEDDMGNLKLVYRYDKCLNVGGDYVEKLRMLLFDGHVGSNNILNIPFVMYIQRPNPILPKSAGNGDSYPLKFSLENN